MLAAYVLLGCVVLLLAPLPFSKGYRDSILFGNGEATVIGVLTVRGAALAILIAMLIFGACYILVRSPAPGLCTGPGGSIGRVYMVVGMSDRESADATHGFENPGNPLPGEPVYSRRGTYQFGYAKWSCALE